MYFTLPVVVAVLAGVAVLVLAVGLATGWRPGRGLPTRETALSEVRARLELSEQDWRRVRFAVQRGRPAPVPLRPAAYELATVLYGRAWSPSGATLAKAAALAYVALALGWLVAAGPSWSVLARPLPTLALGAMLTWTARRQRARLRDAVEANRP